MGNKKLHPSVEKFKAFVRDRPILAQEVKKGTFTLQELFEDWYLLGEEDPHWESFQNSKDTDQASSTKKKNSKDTEGNWMNQIGGIIQKLDANQMQHHIHNISQAIGSIQGVLAQFQGQKQVNNQNTNTTPIHPFSFRKD